MSQGDPAGVNEEQKHVTTMVSEVKGSLIKVRGLACPTLRYACKSRHLEAVCVPYHLLK